MFGVFIEKLGDVFVIRNMLSELNAHLHQLARLKLVSLYNFDWVNGRGLMQGLEEKHQDEEYISRTNRCQYGNTEFEDVKNPRCG